MDIVEQKTIQDIMDLIKSLEDSGDEDFQNNRLLIKDYFMKVINIVIDNALLREEINAGHVIVEKK
jgi:hypothetical protein